MDRPLFDSVNLNNNLIVHYLSLIDGNVAEMGGISVLAERDAMLPCCCPILAYIYQTTNIFNSD